MPLQRKKSPTFKDIAQKTGFSRSTISLALRNHPSIPEKTRLKIVKAAAAIGYKPNPLVAALMAQIRDKKRIHEEKIAIIFRFNETMAERKHYDTFYPALYDAIRTHATKQGFGIDEFYLGKDPLPEKRLSKILSTRGTHGVIFFPGQDDPQLEYPELDWELFATVIIGYNTDKKNHHQVASDYTFDIDASMDRIHTKGHHRIGLAITRTVSKSTNDAWLSRYLLDQQNHPREAKIPPFISEKVNFEKEKVVEWYEKYKPEVILVAGKDIYDILVEAGVKVPQEVKVVNLVQRKETGLAGVNPHTGEVGRAAIDLLASLLRSNQIGLPDFPRSVAIKGHWVDGKSYS
ncbi:LacI family DNA-binding transcriptional regulator [Coraliomargarita sp. W4R72]